jgi:tricorn protease
MMINKINYLLWSFLLLPVIGMAQVDAKIVQYPDVSSTHITFAYGGDIWIVPKSGGVANRLTSAKGEESFPRFSPNGEKIAFSANYDGNVDVYVMPSQGGVPHRLTHHGMSDRVSDWYPDGEHVFFTSSRESEKQRYSQFYKVSQDGGLPEKLPVPYGEFGMMSPDGQKLAYTPKTRAFRTWKRYKGGMATDIFIFDLNDFSSENISNSPFNDEFPMWAEDKIYFLSDRGENQRNNIYSYELNSKQILQITDFSDFDVHFPSLGDGEIVFEAGGKIYLLDLDSEQYKEVPIQVTSDISTLMPRKISVSNRIQNAWLSHDGNRAIVEARGELFSVPAKNGPVINLTQTSGVAERYPSWSPNGKYLAYWSDRSGEYELTIKDMENPLEEKKLTSYGPGYRYQTFWSPDNQKLAFIDKAMDIYIYDRVKNTTTLVDKQKFFYQGNLENFSASWSPNSRYLAFAKNQSTGSNSIAVYDVQENNLREVTAGFYNDMNPVFDPEGKYLFFMTNRDFNPVYSDFEGAWVYANATQIAALPLSNETLSPIYPENDTTGIKLDENGEEEEKEDSEKDKNGSSSTMDIDWEGMENRMVVLPPSAGNYNQLGAIKDKVIYIKYPVTGTKDMSGNLVYYDLEEREEKTLMEKVSGYHLAANGEKVLVVSNGSFGVLEIKPNQKIEEKMPVEKMEMILVASGRMETTVFGNLEIGKGFLL